MSTTGIKKTFGKLTVDNVAEATYKKGIFQAQLRQTVTTTYPSKVVGNSDSDSMFDVDAFGLPDGQEFTSERLCWLDVPKGTKKADIEKILKANPKAKLWRKISHNVLDVLTTQQIGAIEGGVTTLEDMETSKVIKNSDGEIIDRGNGAEYRQYFYSQDGSKNDIDFRGTSKSTTKLSLEELHA